MNLDTLSTEELLEGKIVLLEDKVEKLEEENRILKSDKYHAESNLEIAEDPNFISVPKELSEDDVKAINDNCFNAPYGLLYVHHHIINHFTPEQGGKDNG